MKYSEFELGQKVYFYNNDCELQVWEVIDLVTSRFGDSSVLVRDTTFGNIGKGVASILRSSKLEAAKEALKHFEASMPLFEVGSVSHDYYVERAMKISKIIEELSKE